jgi:predicted PurR-regulated permease PerM
VIGPDAPAAQRWLMPRGLIVLLGMTGPALLALLEGGPRLMAIVIVAYSVVNFVIQSIIQP